MTVVLKPPLPLYLGDVLRLKKPHPCGNHEWTVVRLGADIGLRCLGCERRVMLPRLEVERRLVRFVSRGPEAPTDVPSSGAASSPDVT